MLQTRFGYNLPRPCTRNWGALVKKEAVAYGAELPPERLLHLFLREFVSVSKPYSLLRHTITEIGGEGHSQVKFTGTIRYHDEEHELCGEGNGPIDAFFSAMRAAHIEGFRFVSYHEHAISSGSDAKACAYIELEYKGHDVFRRRHPLQRVHRLHPRRAGRHQPRPDALRGGIGMQNAFNAVGCILLLALAGAGVYLLGWVRDGHLPLLSALVIKVALPGMIVDNVLGQYTPESLLANLPALAAAFISVILTLLLALPLGRLLKLPRRRLGVFAVMFAFSTASLSACQCRGRCLARRSSPIRCSITSPTRRFSGAWASP